MSYLRYFVYFTYSGVQHILCCVCFFFRLVYPMLLVSLDCSFLIALRCSLTFIEQQDRYNNSRNRIYRNYLITYAP
jgi:hypothetical protein